MSCGLWSVACVCRSSVDDSDGDGDGDNERAGEGGDEDKAMMEGADGRWPSPPLLKVCFLPAYMLCLE